MTVYMFVIHKLGILTRSKIAHPEVAFGASTVKVIIALLMMNKVTHFGLQRLLV